MKRDITKRLLGLLVMLVLVFGMTITSYSAALKAEGPYLNSASDSVNTPFSAANMFPGDSVVKDFTIEVEHKREVVLYFRSDIREGYEKLAEVLKAKVELPQKNQVLYDGLMRDMPKALAHTLKPSEKEITYRITAYLDTSVGNEYQLKTLIADFIWWYALEEAEDQPDVPQPPTPPEGTPPQTGDMLKVGRVLILVMALLIAGVCIWILLLQKQKSQKEEAEHKKVKRLFMNLLMLVVLFLCLGITTLALTYEEYAVRDNLFETGSIDINLNDGRPVIQANEFIFEPGVTVEKPFFIENRGTGSAYYKIYFADVKGTLATMLDVSILKETTSESGSQKNILLSGKMSELRKDKVDVLQDVLEPGERKQLLIQFHFPEEIGNEAQGADLEFIMSATAVQTKNNPDKEID